MKGIERKLPTSIENAFQWAYISQTSAAQARKEHLIKELKSLLPNNKIIALEESALEWMSFRDTGRQFNGSRGSTITTRKRRETGSHIPGKKTGAK